MDTLKGGTVQRIAKMRRYVETWNANPQHVRKLDGIKQARGHGVGKIATDGGIYRNESCMVADLRQLDAFRDVGHVDELFPRYFDHRGWFADSSQDQVWRGHVWQLPSHDGECLYLVGYIRPDCGDAVLSPRLFRCAPGESSWDKPEGLRDACIAADHMAERDAEKAREHDEKWQEASRANDDRETAREELKMARLSAKSAIRACRELRAAGVNCDAIESAQVIILCQYRKARAIMRAALETIAEKTDAIAELDMEREF